MLIAERPRPPARAGDGAAHAHRGRRQSPRRLPALPAPARRADRLGAARHGSRAGPARDGRPAAARPASSRTTTPARRPRGSGAAASASPRRSTSGTTRTTSTAIKLRARPASLRVSVRGPAGTDTNLVLWQPGTRHVDDLRALQRRRRAVGRPGPARVAVATARARAGWYFVQVKLEPRAASGAATALRDRRHQALEQLLVGHLAQHPRGVADDERPRRDVLRHDGAGADERLLADLDPGTEDRRRRRRARRAGSSGPSSARAASRCGP